MSQHFNPRNYQHAPTRHFNHNAKSQFNFVRYEGPIFNTFIVGPAEAKQILGDRNDKNRAITNRKVNEYAEMMAEGTWLLNGDTIRIGKDGKLKDGQHRLLAIIKSGVKIPLTIVENVTNDAFKTIDKGKKRSMADTLTVQGIKNSTTVASVSRLIHHWRIDKENPNFSFINVGTYKEQDFMPVADMYMDEIQEVLKKLKGTSVAASCSCFSGLIAVIVILREHNRAVADEFTQALIDGHSYINSPAITLRDRLLSNRESSSHKWNTEVWAMTIKAFNRFKKKQILKLARYSFDEKFPELE